jgi:acetyl-CoA C-acetyltransferase
VAGELADLVVVAGVEQMTDRPGDQVTAALAMAADADFEAENGLSFVALNALLMRRYMHEYEVCHADFAPFAINAHKNAVGNPNALFPHAITAEDFCAAKMIADPVNLLDSSPVCDGAAAVVLCPTALARPFNARPVRVRASSAATDSIAVHDRRDLLGLEGAALSASKAYVQAKLTPKDIDVFELHDAFTIMSVLSLEACGFAERGRGVRLGSEGDIAIGGQIPITTMGGLKARGHPVGATGIYQIIEVALQLREQAGTNQVRDARLGMAQNIGGSGATVVTTILEAVD